MNFDFIKSVHIGQYGKKLIITGRNEPDTLVKIVAECGSGNNRKGIVTYYKKFDSGNFEADVIVLKE